ncbi:hypothetical protein [Kitasatospora mediocidica]|uniref:hypothetical protein n=1 Tax=Kitasatospora mediocidica TaxID=58352 RepID=UPI000568F6D4|nr:hypothetical protein [Kitasatospora mediocidica]
MAVEYVHWLKDAVAADARTAEPLDRIGRYLGKGPGWNGREGEVEDLEREYLKDDAKRLAELDAAGADPELRLRWLRGFADALRFVDGTDGHGLPLRYDRDTGAYQWFADGRWQRRLLTAAVGPRHVAPPAAPPPADLRHTARGLPVRPRPGAESGPLDPDGPTRTSAEAHR